jgi:hypothetical protein
MEHTRREVPWNLPREHDSLAATKLVRTRDKNQNNTQPMDKNLSYYLPPREKTYT